MKILAIDPSLTNTAVVLGDENPDEFEANCFCSKPQGTAVMPRTLRALGLSEDVADWVREYRGYEKLVVYIEGYSFGSNDSNARYSSEYGGLLRHELIRLSDTIYEVAPTTLKKFCTGKGAGKKEMVIAHLMKRYDVEFSTNDEFDAYGLYRLGLVAEGLCEAANQAQREAVDTVLGRTVKKAKKRKAVQ